MKTGAGKKTLLVAGALGNGWEVGRSYSIEHYRCCRRRHLRHRTTESMTIQCTHARQLVQPSPHRRPATTTTVLGI